VINAAIFSAAALIVGAYLLFHGKLTHLRCALFAVLLVTEAGIGLSSLGLPKPIMLEMQKPPTVTVLAYTLDEGQAIYLWVGVPGLAMPVAYQIPWSKQTAQSLFKAAEQAKKMNTALKMSGKPNGKPGEKNTVDNEKPLFYADPQHPNPTKMGEGN